MSNQDEINHIKLKIENNVAVLVINSPQVKVNSLNPEFMFELHHLLEEITSNSNIHGIVLMSGKKDCFIAGADISMLERSQTLDETIKLSRNCQEIFSKIEKNEKPIIAVIHGSCLGGGLEIALACHYRIAFNSKSTKFALPEVKLGLIPGGGGTQRLPKLIGLSKALDMMLTGRMITAHTAHEIGLVDLLEHIDQVSNNPISQIEKIALDIASNIITGKIAIDRSRNFWKKIMDYALQFSWIKNQIFENAKKTVVTKTQGFYPAPFKILEVVLFGLGNDAETAYEYEAKAFGQMLMTDESKGLIHVFRGQTECKKNKFGSIKNLTNIAVIGAGSKRDSITQLSLTHQCYVTVLAATITETTKLINQIRINCDNSIKKKKLSEKELDDFLSKLTSCTDYQPLNCPDLIIEALSEDLDIKNKLFKNIEKCISTGSILILTSFTIPITTIAAETSFPDKIVGINYLPPIEKSQVVEIITTELTSQAAAALAVNLALKQGKVVIKVKDSPGFYIMRILTAAILEAVLLLQEGAEPSELDILIQNFGFPVGIMTLANEFGWTCITKLSQNLKNIFGKRFNEGNQNLLDEVAESGLNIFQTHQILQKYRLGSKYPSNAESKQFRIIARLVNEAVFCLGEKIIVSPMEGDVGAVFGLGFPPFTGGPFRWVDSIGVDKFVEKLEELQQCQGPRFQPAQTLMDMVKSSNKKFYFSK